MIAVTSPAAENRLSCLWRALCSTTEVNQKLFRQEPLCRAPTLAQSSYQVSTQFQWNGHDCNITTHDIKFWCLIGLPPLWQWKQQFELMEVSKPLSYGLAMRLTLTNTCTSGVLHCIKRNAKSRYKYEVRCLKRHEQFIRHQKMAAALPSNSRSFLFFYFFFIYNNFAHNTARIHK